MGYHGQLAFYKDAVELTKPNSIDELWIVAIESKPPYAVSTFILTPAAEDLGRRQYRTWLEEFLQCESANHWPGFVPGVIDAPDEALGLVGIEGELLEVAE